jgi:putative methionine-R-sulfoxide reductase with GAF domain
VPVNKFLEIRDRIKELNERSVDRPEVFSAAIGLLKENFAHYDWVGIYVLEGDMLALVGYLGKPTQHERIPLDKGICGAAAREKNTVIMDDVRKRQEYLACSLATRSEIVVPIMHGGEVLGEIDIDSDTPKAFDDDDRRGLELVAEELAKAF